MSSTSTITAARAKEVGAQVGEAIKAFYLSLPLGVASVLASVVVLQTINFVAFYTLPGCLSGELVFSSGFLIRVFTLLSNAFLHTGWSHLLVNMISFAPLAGSLERSIGTLPFFHLILVIIVCNSVIQLFLSFFASFLLKSFWTSCSQGLSGVIFALFAAEFNKGDATGFIVFGTPIPGFAWPWILLIATQILFRNVSLFGHMAGIVVGTAYARDWIAPFIPSNPYFTYIEESRLVSWMARIPSYVHMPGVIALPSAFEGGVGVMPGSFPSNNNNGGGGASVSSSSSSSSPPPSLASAGFLDRIRKILSPPSAAGYQTLAGGDEESLLAGPLSPPPPNA